MCPLCLTSLAVTVTTTTGAGAAAIAAAARLTRSFKRRHAGGPDAQAPAERTWHGCGTTIDTSDRATRHAGPSRGEDEGIRWGAEGFRAPRDGCAGGCDASYPGCDLS